MTRNGDLNGISTLYGGQDDPNLIKHNEDERINENQFQGSEDRIMKDHIKIFPKYLQPLGDLPYCDSPEGTTKIMVLSSQKAVGKSIITFFLASAMSHAKFRVLLVNLDRQSSSMVKIIKTFYDNFSHECHQFSTNDEVDNIFSLSERLDFVDYCKSGCPGPDANANATEIDYYNANFRSIISSYDCVLFDTHTGLNELNLSILQDSNIAILVSTPDATSISETYALLKASASYIVNADLCLVINQVLEKKTSLEVYNDLNLALQNFMDREIKLLGLIQADEIFKNFPRKPDLQQVETGKISALKQIEEMAPKLLQKRIRNNLKWT
jgi:flagellar biosynthesis protein FlhG